MRETARFAAFSTDVDRFKTAGWDSGSWFIALCLDKLCRCASKHTIIREQVRPDGQINLGLEAEIQQLIYSSSAAQVPLLLRPMLVRP